MVRKTLFKTVAPGGKPVSRGKRDWAQSECSRKKCGFIAKELVGGRGLVDGKVPRGNIRCRGILAKSTEFLRKAGQGAKISKVGGMRNLIRNQG